MTPAEINKTSAIAKVRIFRGTSHKAFKTFQIIANELPIFLLSHVNDILIVCSACEILKSHYITNKILL